MSVSKVATGHENAQATSAPKLEPPTNIRLESGDVVLKSKGDAAIASEVDGVPESTFRWRKREA